MYGRAYVQGGAVVALHVSNRPIDLIVMDGCDIYDLTLSGDAMASDLTFADGAVSGPAVLTCTAV